MAIHNPTDYFSLLHGSRDPGVTSREFSRSRSTEHIFLALLHCTPLRLLRVGRGGVVNRKIDQRHHNAKNSSTTTVVDMVVKMNVNNLICLWGWEGYSSFFLLNILFYNFFLNYLANIGRMSVCVSLNWWHVRKQVEADVIVNNSTDPPPHPTDKKRKIKTSFMETYSVKRYK